MKEIAKQSLVSTREIFSAISFIEVRLYISKKKKMLPEKKKLPFFVIEFQLTVILRTNSNIHQFLRFLSHFYRGVNHSKKSRTQF